MNQNKGFFAKLFDFSFSSFIAPQVVGVLYVLSLVAATLLALVNVFYTFQYDFVEAVGTLMISVLCLLIYAIFLRVFLESFIAIIRTADNTRILAENVLNNTQNPNSNA